MTLPTLIPPHLRQLESLALEMGAVSTKILVAETQTFFIAQFDHPPQGSDPCPNLLTSHAPAAATPSQANTRPRPQNAV